MAKFQSVRFGENTPVSYDKLNYMMLNDQYNKDELSKIPKGILATSKQGLLALLPSVPSVQNFEVDFSVDDSRLVKITVACGYITTSVTGNIMNVSLQIDGIDVGPTATGVGAALDLVTQYYRPIAELAHIVSPPLTKGVHTLKLVVSGTGSAGNGLDVPTPLCRIFVEDIGRYINQYTEGV
jgi:hypothetical protein